MQTDDLAFVADALLALCEKNPRAPFFTDPIFERRLREQQRREPLFSHLAVRHGDDELLRRECEGLLNWAGLTFRQSEVFTKKLEGWTFEQIGAESGNTKQAAQRVFIQALKKLTKAFHVYPYTGLSDTYRREVRRGHRPTGWCRI